MGVGEGTDGFVVLLYGKFTEPLDPVIMAAAHGVKVCSRQAERPEPLVRAGTHP